jgi:hypothetical protein
MFFVIGITAAHHGFAGGKVNVKVYDVQILIHVPSPEHVSQGNRLGRIEPMTNLA